MKKVIFFCLYIFLSNQLFAQSFEKKQITNFNYDSRGASFPIYPMGYSTLSKPPLFYEAHDGNSVNIMMMSYNPYSDSFYSSVPITANNFKNINPIAMDNNWYPNTKMNLVWQTNENGNWDIVMRTFFDSIWGEKKFLLDSPGSETNPKWIINSYDYISNYDEFEFLYEKNNSVYLYHQKDTLIKNEVVFQGNDTIFYTQPSGVYIFPYGGSPQAGLYVVVTARKTDGSSIIKYRIRDYYDSLWKPIQVAFDSNYSENPKFFRIYNDALLSFESKVNGLKSVSIFTRIDQLGHNWEAIRLLDDPLIQYSDFTNHFYLIITQRQSLNTLTTNASDFEIYSPHSYKIIKNDSVFVTFNPLFFPDQLFFTNVKNTSTSIGNLGMYPFGYGVSYAIWEDSANGHINLFGVKRLDPIGDVNDKIISVNFILYQNYPNPFNPKTIIKYELLSRDHVTIKVFDVLGKEVAALVNEEKDAGEYKTVFDGLNLASGIYVYRLSVGNHHLSRKMILLK